MTAMQYTSVDRILAKLGRELQNIEHSEADVIEWIGEALDFLKVAESQEQAVAFVEVKDYKANLPKGLQMVLQIARDLNWEGEENCVTAEEILPDISEDDPLDTICMTDCEGKVIPYYEKPCYRTYFDLQWEYPSWIGSSCYTERFSPVRLADNTFFKSLVCKEIDQTPYKDTQDEYTIVGTTERSLRFSFKEGYVAIAYLRAAVDSETGYPLVPDQISFITAISYYVKWKLAERLEWSGREGFAGLSQKSEQRWLKYVRQAKNWAKMPKSLDDYQDLLEQSHYLIPRHKRYYGFFGNLSTREQRKFSDPNFTNKIGNEYSY